MENEAYKNYDAFMQIHGNRSRFYRYSSTVEDRESKLSLRDPEQWNAGTEFVISLRTTWVTPRPEMISLETRREWEMMNFYLKLCFLREYAKSVEMRDDFLMMQLDTNTAFHRGEEVPLQQIRRWEKVHDPGLHHYVVKTRNAVFAGRALPLIQEATSENRVLIGVGASHLFGKHGVLNLLQRDLGEEYTIERKVFQRMKNGDAESKELSESPGISVLKEIASPVQKVEKEKYPVEIPSVQKQENVESVETLETKASCGCQIQ